jgi:hypothetical protein
MSRPEKCKKIAIGFIQLPFYFYVNFEGCPQAEEPQCLMPGVLPNFVCSHVPMEIFLFYKTGKKPGNQKRVVYIRGGMGGSCTHAFS